MSGPIERLAVPVAATEEQWDELRADPGHGIGDLLGGKRGEQGGVTTVSPGEQDTLIDLLSEDTSYPYVLALQWWALEQGAGGANGDARCYLTLRWGSGRGDAYAEVDVKRGGTLSLGGRVCRVGVRYDGTVGPTLKVGASVMSGPPKSPPGPVTFTRPSEDVLAGATSTAWIVPAFADALMVCDNSDPLAAIAPVSRVQVYRSGAAGAGDLFHQYLNLREQFVPLAESAQRIRVTNAIGAAAVRYTPVFRLAL